MLLGSKIQEKWGQNEMEIGADREDGWEPSPWGQTQDSAVPPAWDIAVPPAPHRVLAQSGQVLDVSPRRWQPQAGTGVLGQVMSVSAPAALPEALHFPPAMGDHQHHSTGTHTPNTP